MAAVEHAEIAQQHVAAVLQADGLVAHAGLLGPGACAGASAQAFAPDASGAGDGDVLQAFAPHQAVAPVAVAIVLILAPFVGLRKVVASAGAFGRGIGRYDGRAHIQIQGDIAHQVNGMAQVAARGEEHGSAAGRGRGLDALVDGRCVKGRAVARGAESLNVEESWPRWGFRGSRAALSRLEEECGAWKTGARAFEEFPPEVGCSRHSGVAHGLMRLSRMPAASGKILSSGPLYYNPAVSSRVATIPPP